MKKSTLSSIEKFFLSTAFAVIGVSGNQKKFGNSVYRAMKERKLPVYPVNPHLTSVEGDECYSSILEVPDAVKSAIIVIPPQATERMVADCVQKGIRALWMQPGSESDRAIDEAEINGITVITGQCLLMFLEPVSSGHALHRWVNKFVGAYPK
jgi:predicted CoA-binding protein